MKPSLVVVAAVIERDGAFLVARRQAGVHLEGYWEFPGGKLQPGEDRHAALRREIREELDAEIDAGDEVCAIAHDYDDRSVDLHFYRCTLVGEPRPMLGQELRWVRRPELAALAFPPADAELISRLLSEALPGPSAAAGDAGRRVPASPQGRWHAMSDRLLARLGFGSAAWSRWRQENPGMTIALDGAKLDGMILTGIDFSGVSLRGASLHATNLMNADLRRADLTGANLAEADLIAANLEGAILTGANLQEADLLGANMTGVRCTAKDLTGALHVPPTSPRST